MAGFVNELDNKNFVIRLQWGFIFLLTVIVLFALYGWTHVQKDLTLHVPPDLRFGAKLAPGEIPPPNVYAFTHYIWQQLNRWSENGDKDYGAAIFKMQAYITPSCRIQLENDMNQKASAGELSLRTRFIQEVPGHGYEESRVVPISHDAWRVVLDTEVFETVRGVRVKDTHVRYPLEVVRFEGDREANPFELAINCFAKGDHPTNIDEEIAHERLEAEAASRPRSSAAGGVAGNIQDAVTQ